MTSTSGPIKRAFEYLSLRLLRRIEIRYRLINSFILLSLLPILVVGYISYVASTRAIEERTQIFSTEVVRQVAKNARLRMAHIDAESGNLVLSDRVQDALVEVAAGSELRQSRARQDMTRLLLDHYGSFDFINQKYLLDKDGRVMDTQVFAKLTQGVMRFVAQAPDLQGRPYWGSYDNGVGQQSIGMLRAVISKSSNQKIGDLFLVIRPEHFSTIFDDIDLGGGTDIYILDAGNGKRIVRSQRQAAGDDEAAEPGLLEMVRQRMNGRARGDFVAFSGAEERGKYFAAYAPIPGTTWFVAATIPEEKLTAEAQAVRDKIVLIGISVFLLSIFLAYFISYSISVPLKELVQKMRATGNESNPAYREADPHQAAATAGLDELGRLDRRFDIMHEAINQKIRQINEANASLERTIDERTAALSAREQESRTLIENSPDTIARYDRDCRRIFVNPAFGATIEGGVAALLGTKPSEIPGGPNAAIYEAKIKEVIATGKNAQFELKWSGKDGAEFCSHIRLTAERDLSGAVVSVLGVGRDITELNSSQAEIKRKELAKSRFLAAAGHDLRQPLAAANLFIDALKLTKPTPAQSQIIQRLDQAMTTFNGLLDALLNISKLDAGVIKPDYRPIDVVDLIDWLEANFAPMAGEKRLAFKLYCPLRERLVVRGDIGLVKSVLMNLVSNAIKFTAAGGILVSARRRGDKVLFQVWDTGMGIRDEHLRPIFDEFYQVNNPQRDRTSGLGLGLSIVERALTLLDEKIICRSRLGRGSVFGFSLPLEDRIANTALQPPASPDVQDYLADRHFAPGKRFVVLEDDELVAQAIVNCLEAIGGAVRHFHDAEDALRHDDIGTADCYIVDYMLGGTLNGIQFLTHLRARLGKPVNAVLVTGDTSPSFVRAAADCDWPVLHKPINMTKLLAGLDQLGLFESPAD